MMKALIVDDERSCSIITSSWLKRLGHESDICDNGFEAIRLLQNKSYDFIITDLSMPEMSGIKLADYIKRKYSIPVMLMTAYDEYMTDKLDFKFIFKKGGGKMAFEVMLEKMIRLLHHDVHETKDC